MTNDEKEKIVLMRNKGISYSKIASHLGISENTIKSFCKRNSIVSLVPTTSIQEESLKEVIAIKEVNPSNDVSFLNDAPSFKETLPSNKEHIICKHCGKPLEQNPNQKRKKFCSEKCRFAWRYAQKEMVLKVYPLVCANCGDKFMSYGKSNRKFCSSHCYVTHRFGTIQRSKR